ncbi:MAG: energy-coupling factor transporter ATPase, partial [Peptococcaceae bacterium]|nr:energy-coupling factor transporter ATPase [Peptococcaceae bacterium]
ENVTYMYPGQQREVLTAINLIIKSAEIVAVLGHNGSGKSTLAQLLNGLVVPLNGQVLVDDLNTRAESSIWQVRSKVGLILQNPDNQLVAHTVEDDVAFGPENLGVAAAEIKQRVSAALASVEMSDYLNWPPSRLSGGQKQRVAIAGILAMQPKYLVLDEATAMLDPKGRKELLNITLKLRSEGIGVVMITHHMSEAALADRVVVLYEGKIAAMGTPQEILSDVNQLRLYGLEAPPIQQVVFKLRQAGMDIPRTIMHASELVEALC